MKILIVGEDRESSDFLRDALRLLDLEIHLLSLELLQKNALEDLDVDLLILNLTEINPENKDGLSEILKNLKNLELPVISFINQSHSLLRSRLLHSGILQVLDLPY